MQSVIAGYELLQEAEQAVRSLEPFHSIQDILIADRNHRTWRKLHPTRADAGESPRNFLVVMNGPRAAIEHARAILRERADLYAALERASHIEYPPVQHVVPRLLLDELADLAGDGSFPASDPPCWTLGRERTSED